MSTLKLVRVTKNLQIVTKTNNQTSGGEEEEEKVSQINQQFTSEKNKIREQNKTIQKYV